MQSTEKILAFLMVLNLIGMGILATTLLVSELFNEMADKDYLYELGNGAILLGIMSLVFLFFYVLEIKSKDKEDK